MTEATEAAPPKSVGGRPYIDLTDQPFGKLTAREIAYRNNDGIYWRCECECGGEAIVRGSTLRSGRAQSCGCNKHKKHPNNKEDMILKFTAAHPDMPKTQIARELGVSRSVVQKWLK